MAALAVVAFGFATGAAYLYLPVLALDFVDVWLLAAARLVLGGGVALWTRRRQTAGPGRSGRQC